MTQAYNEFVPPCMICVIGEKMCLKYAQPSMEYLSYKAHTPRQYNLSYCSVVPKPKAGASACDGS
jgi:hypothetical protein